MPTRKPKDGGDDHEEQPREPHKEQHDAVRIHEAYLQHRLGGGEPASPDAYRRGVEQFEKLPGAVRSTPGIGPAPEAEKKAEKEPEPKTEKAGDEGERK